MELSYYLLILKRNIIILILISITGTVGVSLYYQYYIKQYQAKVIVAVYQSFIVQSPPEEVGKVFNDFKQVVLSNDFAELISNNLKEKGLSTTNLDYNFVKKSTLFNIDNKNKLFSVGFQSEDPEIASATTQLIYEQLKIDVLRLFSLDKLTIIKNNQFTAYSIVNVKKVTLEAFVVFFSLTLLSLLFMDVYNLRTVNHGREEIIGG